MPPRAKRARWQKRCWEQKEPKALQVRVQERSLRALQNAAEQTMRTERRREQLPRERRTKALQPGQVQPRPR